MGENSKDSAKNKFKKTIIREDPLTYNDYASLPDEEGINYELVGGQLEMMSPGASPRHQSISMQMTIKLTQTCEMEYIILPEVDVIFSEYEVRRPDIVMVHRNRKSIITKRGVEGSPDLVVEILSPHSIKRDKLDKLKVYAYFQVQEYWVVDPLNGSLEQYILTNSTYELHEVYTENDGVISNLVPCVTFTMLEIMTKVEDLPIN